ncbi:MAG: hypothetical protein AABW79_01930 [Nanoarchaeota archaeon]
MNGKRGQELSISTLVLIVLAVIVLVLIVVASTGGFSRIGDFFANLGGGKSNVQTVIQGCQVACQTNSNYDWCTKGRDVSFTSEDEAKDSGLVQAPLVQSGRTVKGVTCDKIASVPSYQLSCDTITTCSAS